MVKLSRAGGFAGKRTQGSEWGQRSYTPGKFAAAVLAHYRNEVASALDFKANKKPDTTIVYNMLHTLRGVGLSGPRPMWGKAWEVVFDSVDPAEADRGSMLLQELTDVILPVDEESAADAEERYLAHRFSLTDDSDIMEWWTQLHPN